MDFPESRIVKRELKRAGLDAGTALAVLLKTLADDHLARQRELEPIDDLADDYDPEDPANWRTALEKVLFALTSEANKNTDLYRRHLRRAGNDDAAVRGVAGIAGDLMKLQDDVREIVATCLDRLGSYDAIPSERAP
jgi:hypothetical protein